MTWNDEDATHDQHHSECLCISSQIGSFSSTKTPGYQLTGLNILFGCPTFNALDKFMVHRCPSMSSVNIPYRPECSCLSRETPRFCRPLSSTSFSCVWMHWCGTGEGWPQTFHACCSSSSCWCCDLQGLIGVSPPFLASFQATMTMTTTDDDSWWLTDNWLTTDWWRTTMADNEWQQQPTMDNNRPMTDDDQLTTNDNWLMTNDGWWQLTNDGQWLTDNRLTKDDDGQWWTTMNNNWLTTDNDRLSKDNDSWQ